MKNLRMLIEKELGYTVNNWSVNYKRVSLANYEELTTQKFDDSYVIYKYGERGSISKIAETNTELEAEITMYAYLKDYRVNKDYLSIKNMSLAEIKASINQLNLVDYLAYNKIEVGKWIIIDDDNIAYILITNFKKVYSFDSSHDLYAYLYYLLISFKLAINIIEELSISDKNLKDAIIKLVCTHDVVSINTDDKTDIEAYIKSFKQSNSIYKNSFSNKIYSIIKKTWIIILVIVGLLLLCGFVASLFVGK